MVFVDGTIRMSSATDIEARLRAEIEWLKANETCRPDDRWLSSIVTVGTGRGFVVQGARGRLVITAGQCLPYLPPCDIRFDDAHYENLIGLPAGESRAGASCRFVDPKADLAVLASPFSDEEGVKYSALTEAATPLSITDPLTTCLGSIPLPGGGWMGCAVVDGGPFSVFIMDHWGDLSAVIAGSPIFANDGSAIAVMSDIPDEDGYWEMHQPRLAGALPRWLLRELAVTGVCSEP